ncbi:MAG: hypothetical protein Kow00108_16440 [Calditrichia bacterium]
MALIGSLKELKLPNLIQLNCLEKNTAKLTVMSNNKYGIIYFENGEVVHAEFEPFVGEKAIYAMLELKDGQFKVENDIKAPTITINNSWSNILLEGLRILDEKTAAETDVNLNDIADILAGIKSVKTVMILNIKTMEIYGNEVFENGTNYLLFLWQKSKKVLNLFYSDSIQHIIMRSEKKAYILIEKVPYLVLLEMESSTVLDEHLQTIKKILSF